MLDIERLSSARIFPANTQGIRREVQQTSSCFELPFCLINFLWHFPSLSALEGAELQNTRLVPWCKMERWFSAKIRERKREGHMSHIYVILMTPAIRHTGSLCSDCLLSTDEYVLWELSEICLWSPHEDLVPSQPLCCLLKFTHLWTLYTECTWGLFAFSISSATRGYS